MLQQGNVLTYIILCKCMILLQPDYSTGARWNNLKLVLIITFKTVYKPIVCWSFHNKYLY